MSRARAVIYRSRIERLERRAYGVPVEQVDCLPLHSGDIPRRRPARSMPSDNLLAFAREEIEQVAAGEPRGASD
jgi:hypothetical protein